MTQAGTLSHSDGRIVRGATSRIKHLTINAKVTRDPRLGQLAERNFIRAARVRKVRITLIPETELVGLLANVSVALTPRELVLPSKHGCGYFKPRQLTCRPLASRLAPQCPVEDIAIFIGYCATLHYAIKNPLDGGPVNPILELDNSLHSINAPLKSLFDARVYGLRVGRLAS